MVGAVRPGEPAIPGNRVGDKASTSDIPRAMAPGVDDMLPPTPEVAGERKDERSLR